MIPRETVRRWMIWALAATCACALLFTLMPGIDLAVSGLFYVPGAGFHLQDLRLLQALREGIWLASDVTVIGSLLLLAAGLVVARWRVVKLRVLGFVLAAYALGPGLIVNGLLKSHWGRARPRDVTEFGGSLQFTPPLEISDQCARNCSFVSGESSAVVTFGLLYVLLARGAIPVRMRFAADVAMAAVTLAGAMMRLLFGAHFLSDVLLAASLMTLLATALYLLFGLDRIGSVWSRDR